METPLAILAFDLGGTRLKAGIVRNGVPEPVVVADVGDAPLDLIAATGHDLLRTTHADAVGLSVPGIVEAGTVVSLPGKLASIVGVPLVTFCEKTFGIPAFAVNDAIAYGMGEAVAGAGKGDSRVLVMTIGTGIGVAVIDSGKPVGSGPLQGGILSGQIPFADAGSSTLEDRCSARALAARAAGAYGSVEALLSACGAGDAGAKDIVESYRADLVLALVALAHAHAPAAIVIGGGPVSTSDILLAGVADAVNAMLYPGYSVAIRRATFGDGAALVGLARMAGVS